MNRPPPIPKIPDPEILAARRKHRLEAERVSRAIRAERNRLLMVVLKDYCKICGEQDIACLDFHHLNPLEKERSISEMAPKCSEELIRAEVKKCIVLCANCHRKVHAGRDLL